MPATQTSGDEQQAPMPLVDQGARDEMIKRAVREIAPLEAERKRIGKEIASIKQRLVKGGLGFKIKDFGFALRLYDLEHEDRDVSLATMRECFRALEIGEQLDWLKATGADRQDGDDRDGDSGSGAGYTFETGRAAGLDGKNRDVNPHLEGSQAHAKWDEGWLAGQTELAKDLGRGGSNGSDETKKRGRGRPRRTVN